MSLQVYQVSICCEHEGLADGFPLIANNQNALTYIKQSFIEYLDKEIQGLIDDIDFIKEDYGTDIKLLNHCLSENKKDRDVLEKAKSEVSKSTRPEQCHGIELHSTYRTSVYKSNVKS